MSSTSGPFLMSQIRSISPTLFGAKHGRSGDPGPPRYTPRPGSQEIVLPLFWDHHVIGGCGGHIRT